MATDLRGHTVPANTGHPARSDLLNLGLSVRDPIPVANATAQTALIASLAAIGITASTANPIFTFRADAVAGREIEYTVDGTTFKAIRGMGAPVAFTPTYGGFTATNTYARLWSVGLSTYGIQIMATLTSGVSASMTVSCPVTPRSGYPVGLPVGTAQANHGANVALGGVEISGSNFVFRDSSSALWGAGAPYVWAAGDWIAFTALVEVA